MEAVEFEPVDPPQLPENFDELLRVGVRNRWFEALGYPIIPLLIFGAIAVGCFVAEPLYLGFVFLVPALAPYAFYIHRARNQYGIKGDRWRARISAVMAEPRRWHRVDVICRFVAQPGPTNEMNVMVAEPGRPPRLAGVATRGSAVGLSDGPGWTWGVARKGEPLIVRVDGKTVWCIGPARGRWYTLNARLTAVVVGYLNPGAEVQGGQMVAGSGQGQGTPP